MSDVSRLGLLFQTGAPFSAQKKDDQQTPPGFLKMGTRCRLSAVGRHFRSVRVPLGYRRASLPDCIQAAADRKLCVRYDITSIRRGDVNQSAIRAALIDISPFTLRYEPVTSIAHAVSPFFLKSCSICRQAAYMGSSSILSFSSLLFLTVPKAIGARQTHFPQR